MTSTINRITINAKNLFQEQEVKSFHHVVEKFNERNARLEQILASNAIPEHLKGLSQELALLKILGHEDLYSIMNIAYYNGCIENNSRNFLNGFYTYSRLNFERIKLLGSGGVDHCLNFPFVVEHFAMNDFSRAKEIFKVELGISKTGHKYAKTVTNLIIAILHNDLKMLNHAYVSAEKYLLSKSPNFDRTTVEFLLRIIKKDFGKANESFVELCNGYKKANWIHQFKNPFLKEIGIYPIGLYKLAQFYLGTEKENLSLPKNQILWESFVSLMERGKSCIIFEDKLKGLNRFLE